MLQSETLFIPGDDPLESLPRNRMPQPLATGNMTRADISNGFHLVLVYKPLCILYKIVCAFSAAAASWPPQNNI